MNTTARKAWKALIRTAVVWLVLWSAAPAMAADILLLASNRTDLYTRFVETFSATLDLSGADDARHTLDTIHLDPELPDALPDMARYDLVVTVGTLAASALPATGDSPAGVLHTLLPLSVYRQLETGKPACNRRSAIFIDQPIARQAHLARLLFPQARRLGILLGPTSKQRQDEIDSYRSLGHGELVVRVAGEESDLARISARLLDDSDLLIAVSDPLALNRENARWLLYAAYQRQLPVIGFSSAYVRAGAAAAVFSEPEQMARQAAAMTRDWLNSAQRCLPEPGFAQEFSVSINTAVYSSLGGTRVDEQAVLRELQQEELR